MYRMTRRIHLRADAGPATAPLYLLGVKPDLRVTCDRNVRWYFSRSPASRPSTLRERPRRIGSAWLAQEEESYRRIVPFSVRIETPGHLSRGLCLLPMQMRVACSSARVKKSETANRGTPLAISHFQTRDGAWGDGSAPYPVALI